MVPGHWANECWSHYFTASHLLGMWSEVCAGPLEICDQMRGVGCSGAPCTQALPIEDAQLLPCHHGVDWASCCAHTSMEAALNPWAPSPTAKLSKALMLGEWNFDGCTHSEVAPETLCMPTVGKVQEWAVVTMFSFSFIVITKNTFWLPLSPHAWG